MWSLEEKSSSVLSVELNEFSKIISIDIVISHILFMQPFLREIVSMHTSWYSRSYDPSAYDQFLILRQVIVELISPFLLPVICTNGSQPS